MAIDLEGGSRDALFHAVMRRNRERIRRIIFDWIRDDVGFNVKMTLRPTDIDRLLERLEGERK